MTQQETLIEDNCASESGTDPKIESCCCHGTCELDENEDQMSENDELESMSAESEGEDSIHGSDEHAGVSESESTAQKRKAKQAPPSSQDWQQFMSEFEKQESIEQKLQFVIDFMEKALSQTGSPHFRSFWDARTLSLTLFKENMAPAVRTVLWNKYTDLSKEARRLKEIFDEQSSFAAEQIEIAVKALEEEIAAFDQQLEKFSSPPLDLAGTTLAPHANRYFQLQRELDLLNTQATRVNALRKELIKTEMRVRFKNKFFQRLSAIGDSVFPRRKEQIKVLSQLFIDDIDAFIKNHFSSETIRESLFALRDEIKFLQNIAKTLTLNTNAFTHTRMRLSECWDKIKGEEKERKKEWTEQKAQHKQNCELVQEKIDAYKAAQGAEELGLDALFKQLDEIAEYMRSVSLGREDVVSLKTQIHDLRREIQEKLDAAENARQQQSQDRDRKRREKVAELQNEIKELIQKAPQCDYDAFVAARDELVVKIGAAAVMKNERAELERQMKPFRDLIASKKESALMDMPQHDREALGQLKDLLKERKTRRQEIKEQLEQYRRASGSSGLGFEQAMEYNALIASEKETLEKINQGIEEIEDKIAELEG